MNDPIANADRQVPTTIWLPSLLIIILVALRFSGISDTWTPPLNYYNNVELFPASIFMKNSFYGDSSIFFFFNKFLTVERNDYSALAIFVFASFLTIWFSYRLLRDVLGVQQPASAIFIVLLLCFVDRKIPIHNWGGAIPVVNGFSGVIGHALAISTIYFMAKNKLGYSAVIMTVMLAFHVKGNFILGPVFFFYVLLNKQVPKINFLWLVFPGLFVLYKMATSISFEASPEEMKMLYDMALAYERQDGVFLYQGLSAFLLLIVSFFVYPVLYRRFEGNVRTLAIVLHGLAVVTFVASVAYTSFGYQYFPNPIALMIGPVRSFKFYIYFFYIMSFVLILNTPKLSPLEKVFAMLALIVFHGENIRGFAYPVAILSVGILLPRALVRFTAPTNVILGKMTGALNWINAHKLHIVGTPVISALVVFQLYRGGVYAPIYDPEVFKHTNRWTMDIKAPASAWDAYMELAKSEKGRDFLLYPLFKTRSGNYAWSYEWNMITEKSAFMGHGLHFYFNASAARWFTAHKRMADNLIRQVENGETVSPEIIAYLQELNAAVMLPSEDAHLLNNWTRSRAFGTFRLLEFE